VNPAKTAEPIEMPFEMVTRVGPRNYVIDGVQIFHGKGGFLVIFWPLTSIAFRSAFPLAPMHWSVPENDRTITTLPKLH